MPNGNQMFGKSRGDTPDFYVFSNISLDRQNCYNVFFENYKKKESYCYNNNAQNYS